MSDSAARALLVPSQRYLPPTSLLKCVRALCRAQTKALLNPASLTKFLEEKLKGLGTAACPPYHLAVVIGGTSAEYNLKTVKLASTK